MPRPTDLDKRRALARKAARVLEREGLEIPAARLADALGIKRPTLLYHFPTYGRIVETALEDLLLEQAAFVMSRIEAHEHPIDRLYAHLRAVHEFHRGREKRVVFLSQAIAATAGERLPDILEAGALVFAAQRREAADRVRRGIAEGIVAPCDADALVALVRALIDGLMLSRVAGGVELAPVHDLVWERVLAPLKIAKRSARRKKR
jgi:AcrR family transcriptional regulator